MMARGGGKRRRREKMAMEGREGEGERWQSALEVVWLGRRC